MESQFPGGDRPANGPLPLLIDFLAAFTGLSGDTENAGRIMILGPDGAFVGDASLSARDMQIAVKALAAAQALTEATRGLDLPDSTVLDPELENELEEYCIGLDPEVLMDLAEENPASAVAAFDEITRQNGDL